MHRIVGYQRQRRIHLCCLQKSIRWRHLMRQEVKLSLHSDVPWCLPTLKCVLRKKHFSVFGCSPCLITALRQCRPGVPNPVPGDLPSCRVQFQPWSNIPVGLGDILHAICMRISSVKPVPWLAVNLHHLFSNGAAFNTQSRSSQTSYAYIDWYIAFDMNAILRSLSVIYGSVY